MDFLKKACGFVSDAVKSVGNKIAGVAAAAVVAVSAVPAKAANDYTSLATQVTGELSGVGTILMTIAGSIVAVAVVFLVVRFIRRMIGG